MRFEIITSIISAASILTGSLVGAFFSYLISDKMYKKQLINEKKRDIIDKAYDKKNKNKIICDNVNQIRLDIANALFQSIRTLKYSKNRKIDLYLIPYCTNYSEIIVSLNHLFSVEELSEIYQFYALIEKASKDACDFKGTTDLYIEKNILEEFKNILIKIYGQNYDKILVVDPDSLSYLELFNNQYIRIPFKNILFKLEKYCNLDNLLE